MTLGFEPLIKTRGEVVPSISVMGWMMSLVLISLSLTPVLADVLLILEGTGGLNTLWIVYRFYSILSNAILYREVFLAN